MTTEIEITPQDFHEAFIENPKGEKVLLALETLFSSETSFVAGDPYFTAFNEGQRSVVLHIISQLAKAQQQ